MDGSSVSAQPESPAAAVIRALRAGFASTDRRFDAWRDATISQLKQLYSAGAQDEQTTREVIEAGFERMTREIVRAVKDSGCRFSSRAVVPPSFHAAVQEAADSVPSTPPALPTLPTFSVDTPEPGRMVRDFKGRARISINGRLRPANFDELYKARKRGELGDELPPGWNLRDAVEEQKRTNWYKFMRWVGGGTLLASICFFAIFTALPYLTAWLYPEHALPEGGVLVVNERVLADPNATALQLWALVAKEREWIALDRKYWPALRRLLQDPSIGKLD